MKIKVLVLFIVAAGLALSACAGTKFNTQSDWRDTKRALPVSAEEWEKMPGEFTLVKIPLPYVLAAGEAGATSWRVIVRRADGTLEDFFAAKLLAANPKFNPSNPTGAPALMPLSDKLGGDYSVIGLYGKKLADLMAEDARLILLANSGEHCVKPGTFEVFPCHSLADEYFNWKDWAAGFREIAFSNFAGKEVPANAALAFEVAPERPTKAALDELYARVKDNELAREDNFSGTGGEKSARATRKGVEAALHVLRVVIPTVGSFGLVYGLGSPLTTALLAAGVTGLVGASSTMMAVFTQPEQGSEYLNSFVTNYSLALVRLEIERLKITVQLMDERLLKLETAAND